METLAARKNRIALAEPEDAILTGQTRSMARRLLGLTSIERSAAVDRPGWLSRSCRVFHRAESSSTFCPNGIGDQNRYIVAAMATSLVSIGLVRFTYTPLLPYMIREGWFAERSLVALSSAGLLGFLVGALLGRAAAFRFGASSILNTMNLCASLSLSACAFPMSVAWFFLWRLIGGLSGGAAVVLLASTILPHVSDTRKGIVGGAIFVGFGLGVLASGTLVPLLLLVGLRTAWLGLGGLTLAITTVVWTWWPSTSEDAKRLDSAKQQSRLEFYERVTFFVLFSLISLGLASPMVFFSDFVGRQLHSATSASWGWCLYGLGATIGPLCYGWGASIFGGVSILRIVLLVEALATMVLVYTSKPALAVGVAIVLGSCITGIVPLAQAWLREIYSGDVDAQNRTWSVTATVYAATQAAGGLLFTWLLRTKSHNYRTVFEISAGAFAAAFLLLILVFQRSQNTLIAQKV